MKRLIISIIIFIAIIPHLSGQESQQDYTNIESSWFEGNLTQTRDILVNTTNSIDRYNLVYIELLLKNYNRAMQLTDDLPEEHPEWKEYLRANIYFDQQKYALSLPLLEKHVADNPDDLNAILKIGNALIATGQYEKTRKFLIEKVDDFDDERLDGLIAESYLKEDRLDEALSWLSEGEKRYPDLNILLQMINIYYKTNNRLKLMEYGLKFSTMYSGGPLEDNLRKQFAEKGLSYDFPIPEEKVDDPLVLKIGESLKYEVTYGWITLGNVLINVKDTLTYRGNPCYLVEYQANTADGIPFFTIHNRYLAYQDRNSYIAYKSVVNLDDGDALTRSSFIMNYGEKKMDVYKIGADGRIEYSSRALPNTAVDAMALLFYARNLIKNKQSRSVTTIINDSFRTTDIFYKKETKSIDVLNQSVLSEEVYAKANFTGLAGMTGDVWGWFIDTGQSCVPAIGKAKIILGSVTLTLIKWRE